MILQTISYVDLKCDLPTTGHLPDLTVRVLGVTVSFGGTPKIVNVQDKAVRHPEDQSGSPSNGCP